MHTNVGFNGKVFMNGQYLGEVVDYQLKDSGKREDFETGSRRDTRVGKGRFDLISPRFLRRLAVVLERGAKKYGDRNWEKGQPLGRYLDSALRHINCLLDGMKDEDHAAQAAWNLHAFIHTAELIQEGKLPYALDDLGYTDEQGDEALPDDTPDVAGSPRPCHEGEEVTGGPVFSCNNPCGSPGCVICYPPNREAGLPATSGKGLSPLADRMRGLVMGWGGAIPISEVFNFYICNGFTASEVIAAKNQLGLSVVRREPDGLICWSLPEGK